MFLKSPTPRKFTYQPRFYDPENDGENGHRRIQFRRLTTARPPQRRSMLLYFLLAAILIYVLLQFKSLVRNDINLRQDKIKVEELIIEE